MSDQTTGALVPLERLEALERQFFPMLPDNPPGRDLRAVVLEAIAARKAAAFAGLIPDMQKLRDMLNVAIERQIRAACTTDSARARLKELTSERAQWTGGPGDPSYRSKVNAEIRALEAALAANGRADKS